MAHLAQRALGALGRFNDRHPWSHNDVYSGWVVRQARRVRTRGGRKALDVGCGTGHLVALLSRELPNVVGLEPDQSSAELARFNTRHLSNVLIKQSAWEELDHEQYDLVTFVAALHHLPLRETLHTVRKLIAPGGRLVVVGVARETAHDRPLSLCSTILNPLVGLILHPHAAVELPARMRSPVTAPSESFREIAFVARQELPGVVLRRRLFWRYTAIWMPPPSP